MGKEATTTQQFFGVFCGKGVCCRMRNYRFSSALAHLCHGLRTPTICCVTKHNLLACAIKRKWGGMSRNPVANVADMAADVNGIKKFCWNTIWRQSNIEITPTTISGRHTQQWIPTNAVSRGVELESCAYLKDSLWTARTKFCLLKGSNRADKDRTKHILRNTDTVLRRWGFITAIDTQRSHSTVVPRFGSQLKRMQLAHCL